MITLLRLQADHFKSLRDVDINFPTEGSILIEGQNESGKSTLFEAVYAALYGRALIGEDEGRAKLEDLIAFDVEWARVVLTFATPTAHVEVERRFTRGRAQTASVTVTRNDDTPSETRHGTSAVNERVLREMGNLDADTLRNSCFVEQKELGRLESLSKNEREKAIERLLGLERLTKLAEHYQQENRDTGKQLIAATKRAELANATAAARAAAEDVAAARAALDIADARDHINMLRVLDERLQALDEQAEHAKHAQYALQERTTRAASVQSWLRDADDCARDASYLTEIQSQQTLSASERQAQRDAIVTQQIPAVTDQITRITAARDALEAATAARQRHTVADATVTQAEARVQALRTYQHEQTQANDQLIAAQTLHTSATAMLHTAEQRDALATFAQLATTTGAVSDLADQELRLQQQLEDATNTQKQTLRRSQFYAVAILMIAFLTIIPISVMVGLYDASKWLILLPEVVVMSVFAISVPTIRSHNAANKNLNSAKQALTAIRAQSEGARRAGADPARLEAQRAELHRLGITQNLTGSAAQQLSDDLASRVPEAASVIRATLDAAIAKRAAAQNAVAAVASHRPEDAGDVDSTLVAATVFHQTTLTAANLAQREMTQATTVARQGISDAALAPDTDIIAVTTASAQAQQHLKHLREQAEHLSQPASESNHNDIAARSVSLRAQWQDLVNRAATLGLHIPTMPSDATTTARLFTTSDATAIANPTTVSSISTPANLAIATTSDATTPVSLATASDATTIAAAVRQVSVHAREQLTAIDVSGANAQNEAMIAELARIDEAHTTLSADHDAQQAALSLLLARYGIIPLAPQVQQQDAWAAHWPALAQLPPGERTDFTERLQSADNRRVSAEDHAARVAKELPLAPAEVAALDVASCQAEIVSIQRRGVIAQRAVATINTARQRIMRQVLPTTERNMRVILPLLTAGRYHDVRLTAPEDDDATELATLDYRIRVWDHTARRYVGKAIFSGGAKDQCSLALRLSFALATLPQELGIAPGFLFLDEPLSAFDSERANALVELLTRGQIARAFAQVVVISHQHAFAPSDFRYHLRMERGRVVASDLPAAQNAVAMTLESR